MFRSKFYTQVFALTAKMIGGGHLTLTLSRGASLIVPRSHNFVVLRSFHPLQLPNRSSCAKRCGGYVYKSNTRILTGKKKVPKWRGGCYSDRISCTKSHHSINSTNHPYICFVHVTQPLLHRTPVPSASTPFGVSPHRAGNHRAEDTNCGRSSALRNMRRAVGILVLVWVGGKAISTSAKPQPLGKHRTARGLASSSISSSLSGNCSSELLDCSHDETCLACISSGHVNTAECHRLYPAQNDSESTYCHTIASAYCCAAYQMTEYSIDCVDSELVVDYWVSCLRVKGTTILANVATIAFV